MLEKSQPSVQHNSHIHTTFCKRILWHITMFFPVSPTQAHIQYYNSPLATILTLCAVVLPAPSNRHCASRPLTSTIGHCNLTASCHAPEWSGVRCYWHHNKILTRDSELLGNCTFLGSCLYLLSRVSLCSQGRWAAEVPAGHLYPRETQDRLVKHKLPSASGLNKLLIHSPKTTTTLICVIQGDPQSPHPSHPFHKHSAMTANIGSTLGALPTHQAQPTDAEVFLFLRLESYNHKVVWARREFKK